jgi:hypothetical protein
MSSKALLSPKPTAAQALPAGRVHGAVLQRRCACGGSAGARGKCEDCAEKETKLQRQAAGAGPAIAPPIVHEVLRSPGQPLDADTRAFMEPRFGHDFRAVRIHTDPLAAESARAVQAEAYTVGRHLVFGAGRYQPRFPMGRSILAHELTHVVQQAGDTRDDDRPIELCDHGEYEGQAETAAHAIGGADRIGVESRTAPALMRLSPDEFRNQLGSTSDQQSAIAALFANAQFSALWNYMNTCPTKPRKNLGPLALKVSPGLKLGGVERFGGYEPGPPPTLEINPTKPEHKNNPAELVDTITHELIHAISALESGCVAAGAAAAPLGGAATAVAPSRAALAGQPQEVERLMKEQGPGASDPCGEFLDINAAAQKLVIGIVRSNIAVAKVGRPTLTFVNEILRTKPPALAEYTQCRDVACAKTVPAEKDKAIADCSTNVLVKYGAPPPQPTLPRPEMERPKFGPLYRPRTTFTPEMEKSLENL